MPHQCLKCGKIYTETKFIEKGCPNCGGKFFYYIKKSVGKRKEEKIFEEKREKIENIVRKIEFEKERAKEETEKIRERIESIDIKEIGDYEINVKKLVEDGSIIIHKDGIYFIYLPSVFKKKK